MREFFSRFSIPAKFIGLSFDAPIANMIAEKFKLFDKSSKLISLPSLVFGTKNIFG